MELKIPPRNIAESKIGADNAPGVVRIDQEERLHFEIGATDGDYRAARGWSLSMAGRLNG